MLTTKDGYKLAMYKTPEGNYHLGCSKYLVESSVAPQDCTRLETLFIGSSEIVADGKFFSYSKTRSGFCIREKQKAVYTAGEILKPGVVYCDEQYVELGVAITVMNEQDKLITVLESEIEYTDLQGLYTYKGEYVMKSWSRTLKLTEDNAMLWWNPETPSHSIAWGYGWTTTSEHIATLDKIKDTLLSSGTKGFVLNEAVKALIEQNVPMFNKFESVSIEGNVAYINYGYEQKEVRELRTVRKSREVYKGNGSGHSGGDGYSKGFREWNPNKGRSMETEYYDAEEEVLVGYVRTYPDGTVCPEGQWRLAF